MIVRLPYMVQDPYIAPAKGLDPVDQVTLDGEDFYLDGPVCRRVAVLDFDPQAGTLRPGAKFRPPAGPGRPGEYLLGDGGDPRSPDFIQVSVFATVLKTMVLYEDPDTLGRSLVWAFGAPQLLVVPRAGQWDNAFYERDSHSLQFFHFPSAVSANETVYTSLSHDIISHETGHAILDGIAPHLYHAVTPQSLALHEAIADLTALIMAFLNDPLRSTVLSQTNGSIEWSSAFSWVAEEFGRGRDPSGRVGYLRSLLNRKTLDPDDRTKDEQGRPNRVARDHPHELSQVLSGALYSLVIRMHEAGKRRFRREGLSEAQAANKGLWVAAQQLKRMTLRALDFLPPGEVSFADYGRAIIAADQASHPDAGRERDWLRREFVGRHMAPDPASLEVETGWTHPALEELDLATLVGSDWAAYDFANRNRDLLGIPAGVPFRVWPRLDVTKHYYRRTGEEKIRECIFKVSWDQLEPNPARVGLPQERRISVGTTLAFDWQTRRVRARLTSELSQQQRADRDRLLSRLAGEGLLQLGRHALGPDGRELRSVVPAQVLGRVMRVRGAARLLHIAGEA